MKRIVMFLLLASMLAWAKDVECPFHSYAACYWTGETAPNDSSVRLYKCSCGDTVWVRE